MKILIVDDEIKIREVVSEYAAANGYECDQASNGKDAVEMVQSSSYDCVILDIMMPELDGFSACRKIKSIRNIPVIGMIPLWLRSAAFLENHGRKQTLIFQQTPTTQIGNTPNSEEQLHFQGPPMESFPYAFFQA